MSDTTSIQLAHGGGGRLSRDLIEAEIVSRFGGGALAGLPDGATLPSPDGPLVFTTDSFVVQPIEFPGGNIGHLAVHGTVNDLSACGARPRWLSMGLILEEGLEIALLRRVLDAVHAATAECGVQVVTGDTKVVAKGQCDGLYVNTSGIGEQLPGFALAPEHIRPGDVVLASGTLGDHGAAILSCRRNIEIAGGPQSDTAPVSELVAGLAPHAADVRFMRDPTRGGAASVLNEVVEGLDVDIVLQEPDVPLSNGTRAVCEMLGLDPLHMASEGRLLLVCAPSAAGTILETWRKLPAGRQAAPLGVVAAGAKEADGHPVRRGRVIMQTVTGGRRLVDVPRGELLPRIC